MATSRTSPLAFHIEPNLTEALRATATREYRSIANMVAVLIWDYRGREGIGIPEHGAVSVKGRKKKE